ncbi:hypothetical protein Cni_G02562 [Canna indica]|uniref:C2H2-type domain-containing protein n=1 Tax=Canna indica TaxID=4628 RepID=A0AAQ3JPY4_9LILI|nr:hypothetical protein Cni_G02562 [Canna indica]
MTLLLDEDKKSMAAAVETSSISKLVSASSDGVDVSITATVGNSRSRLHKCSICGSKFSFNQVFVGHMRRQRLVVAATTEPAPPKVKKEKHVLLEVAMARARP